VPPGKPLDGAALPPPDDGRLRGRDLAGWGHQWLRTEGVPTIWLDEGGTVRQDVPRWQRVGAGLFDLDREWLDIAGYGPVPVVVGSPFGSPESR
jgi:hypothetical protein